MGVAAAKFTQFSEVCGTPGTPRGTRHGQGGMLALKNGIIADLQEEGLELGREQGDREDVPIDFRFLGLLFRAAEDPETGLGHFAQGVRVGPGTRMPRLPARRRSGGWRPRRTPEHISRRRITRERQLGGGTTRRCGPWQRKCTTCSRRRVQLIRLLEAEAKAKYPRIVIASLGSCRKDRRNGEVTARALHDGTNGLAVNTKTRLRDQERSPISSDFKRAMREKAHICSHNGVKEAHRQIPIDPRDWHLFGCQVERGADVFVNTVGTFGITSASYYWSRVSSAVGRLTQYLASDQAETWHMVVADDFHLECTLSPGVDGVLCALLHGGSPTLLAQDEWRRHRCLGRGSNFSIEPDTWASLSEGPSGSYGGLGRRRSQTTFT